MSVTAVRPSELQTRLVARIREAMEYRWFTVDEMAGAADMPPTLLARRLEEPDRFMLCELEAIAKACQVPVLFLFDAQEGDL